MSKIKENQNLEDIYNYMVINIIGTGSFGTCYKVQHKITQKYYVWKAVDYGSMSLHEKELLVTEVNLIGTLKHPHIVQYFGRIIHKNSGTLYIIMEWCERGDLNSLINSYKSKHKNISESFIWKVLYQTAKALEACHSLLNRITVLHRDIKPANIFLDKNYNVKLGDFGLAKILINNVNFSNTVVGTPYYMSPEQIHGSKYNKKTDVWSLGCLIYELCCLNQPFNGNDLTELKENITKNRLSRIPSVYSDYLDKMIKLLLNSNHQFRPSVEMIIHHPTVICNYDKNAIPSTERSHNGDGDSSYFQNNVANVRHKNSHLKDDNIDNIIKKVEKLSKKTQQLYIKSDPQAITEDVYNRKLMGRLKLLREKETVLKAKEDSLKTKEFMLKTRESSLIQKQKQIEKREREIALQRDIKLKSECTRVSSISKSVIDHSKLKRENRKFTYTIDLDSTTCSADPGDTSIMPTAVKLDPSKIIKPSFVNNRKNDLNQDYGNKNQIFYDPNIFGDNVRNWSATFETVDQPLLSVHNCIRSQMSGKCKHSMFVKKYENFIYKK